METQESPQSSRTPPYGAWGTFETTLDHFNDVGITNIIDRHALPSSLSGGSAYEMLGAFKYFELIDKDGKPNLAVLSPLVNPKTRKETMVELLKQYYAGLFALPLESANPGQVSKWFAENGTQSTAKRAQAFFIRGAKANNIALHPMVAKGVPATSVPKSGPKNKRKGGTGSRSTNRNDTLQTPPPPPADSVIDKMLAKFPEFNPEWDAAVQQKWFESFSRLQDELRK